MSEIPDDIRKAAKACYEACEYGDSGEIVDCIGAVILAERQRIASDLFNRNGFMTAESGDGHFVKISFNTMNEMHEFHHALVSLSQFKLEN